jgi:hypothetical protein
MLRSIASGRPPVPADIIAAAERPCDRHERPKVGRLFVLWVQSRPMARQWAVGSYFVSDVGPVQTLIVQRCA